MSAEEYERCVEMFSDIVYRYCLMTVSNRPSAQDIVQDCFLSLWINHKNVDFNAAKTYLIRTAYYNIVNIWRKKTVKSKFENEIREQNAENQYNGVKDAMNYYLETLPNLQKNAIILRDMQGYSYEEIAQITDSSLESVKTAIYRARKKLKELIKKKENII